MAEGNGHDASASEENKDEAAPESCGANGVLSKGQLHVDLDAFSDVLVYILVLTHFEGWVLKAQEDTVDLGCICGCVDALETLVGQTLNRNESRTHGAKHREVDQTEDDDQQNFISEGVAEPRLVVEVLGSLVEKVAKWQEDHAHEKTRHEYDLPEGVHVHIGASPYVGLVKGQQHDLALSEHECHQLWQLHQ